MLSGIRVVELASFVAAPSACAMLAEWGADVIKVEPPTGDPYRRGFEGRSPDDQSPHFLLDNRGKRSIAIDTRSPDGVAELHALIAEADVLVTNVRMSSLKKLKLDWPTLKETCPRLIHAVVTGYGTEGPDSDLPGYDVSAFWSRSSAAFFMTPDGQDPLPLRTGIGDHMCALATTSGVLAALYERERTGRGRAVETSLLRTGTFAVGADLAAYLRLGKFRRTGTRANAIVPLVNYFKIGGETWICLMPRNFRQDWPKIARLAGRGDLIDDPRFCDDKQRLSNTPALIAELDSGFAKRSFEEVCEDLVTSDLVWSLVQSPEQLVEDQQAQAAGCFVTVEDRSGEMYSAPATPVRFPGAERTIFARVPELGEHTDAIRQEVAELQRSAGTGTHHPKNHTVEDRS